MNHDNQDDQALLRAASESLRRSENIDGPTAAKLRAARQHALSAVGTPSLARRLLVPASAFAVVALGGTLLIHPRQPQAPAALTTATATQNIDTLDLLTDDMSPAFYHDLDFYRWLEQRRPHA